MDAQEPPRSATQNSTAPSLANRYGAPKRALGRRTVRWLVAAALVLAVGAAAVVTLLNTQRLEAKDIAFEITSDTSATVTIDITKPADAAVECSVQVLNEEYAVVGWSTVRVPAGGGRGQETVRRTVELRTESIGTSGGHGSCWEV